MVEQKQKLVRLETILITVYWWNRRKSLVTRLVKRKCENGGKENIVHDCQIRLFLLVYHHSGSYKWGNSRYRLRSSLWSNGSSRDVCQVWRQRKRSISMEFFRKELVWEYRTLGTQRRLLTVKSHEWFLLPTPLSIKFLFPFSPIPFGSEWIHLRLTTSIFCWKF